MLVGVMKMLANRRFFFASVEKCSFTKNFFIVTFSSNFVFILFFYSKLCFQVLNFINDVELIP